MRKIIFIALLILALALTASAQDFWHVKTAMNGIAAMPQDDKPDLSLLSDRHRNR